MKDGTRRHSLGKHRQKEHEKKTDAIKKYGKPTYFVCPVYDS